MHMISDDAGKQHPFADAAVQQRSKVHLPLSSQVVIYWSLRMYWQMA